MQPTEHKTKIEGQFIYLYKTTTTICLLLTTTITALQLNKCFFLLAKTMLVQSHPQTCVNLTLLILPFLNYICY